MRYANLRPGTGFRPLRSLLYYSQRVVTVRWLRALCVRAIAGSINLRMRWYGRPLAAAAHPRQSRLDIDGYLPLGQLLSQTQCDDIHAYLRDKQLVDRQGGDGAFDFAAMAPETRMADYLLEDIVNCPHLLALANDPLLVGMAQAYIGCRPTMSALSLRWSTASRTGPNDLQAFHRDADDWRYVKVMVYLTDVGPGDGPHRYVAGTHLDQAPIRLRRYSETEVHRAFPPDAVLKVLGQRGDGFAVDTAGIHKGEAPTGQPRLLLQIQYSLLPAYFYAHEPVAYRGTLHADPYLNRLIAKRPIAGQ